MHTITEKDVAELEVDIRSNVLATGTSEPLLIVSGPAFGTLQSPVTVSSLIDAAALVQREMAIDITPAIVAAVAKVAATPSNLRCHAPLTDAVIDWARGQSLPANISKAA